MNIQEEAVGVWS